MLLWPVFPHLFGTSAGPSGPGGRLLGEQVSSNCNAVSSREGGKKHFSNKQSRGKINKDVCNEFLIPEIAWQEPSQDD